MITELLDAAINEVEYQQKYEISEFQLGTEPMKIFIAECLENMGIPAEANISSVNKYKGIRVMGHPSVDAVMYCLQLKITT